MITRDTLQNLVASLGTDRDKAFSSAYISTLVGEEQLFNAYKSAWLPRKIVDIPALDATRKWRSWKADQDQIELLETEEKRLGVQSKVQDAMKKARLWGGAAIYIALKDNQPDQPINPEAISLGDITHLSVLSRRQISVMRVDEDPTSPTFNKPIQYQFSVGPSQQFVHPSRIIHFNGNPPPDEDLQSGYNLGWGDSILQSVMDAVKNADSASANVASMLFEGKIDVVKIPQLMNMVSDEQYRKDLMTRMQLAMTLKSINGSLILDAEESYESKQLTFATLPDIMGSFLQQVAGAADIPVTRLLGQAPGGLNATGDNDIRNYYDRVNSYQSLVMSPAMAVFDEMLIRSATGTRDPDIWYDWNSLWQTTDKERAEIGKTVADTIKIINDTGLIPPDVLSRAAVNAMTETGMLPGIDDDSEAVDIPEEEDEENGDDPALMADASPTSAMKAEARKGLAWRSEFGRGGTAVGVARARDIVNGKQLSSSTIKRMISFFARHEVDKKAEGFSSGEKGYPSNGRIAWALWGGDAGKSWANAQAKRMGKQ